MLLLFFIQRGKEPVAWPLATNWHPSHQDPAEALATEAFSQSTAFAAAFPISEGACHTISAAGSTARCCHVSHPHG